MSRANSPVLRSVLGFVVVVGCRSATKHKGEDAGAAHRPASAPASLNSAATEAASPLQPKDPYEADIPILFTPAHQLQSYRGPRIDRLSNRCAVTLAGETRCFLGPQLPVAKNRLGTGGLILYPYEEDRHSEGCLGDNAGALYCWGRVRSRIYPTSDCTWTRVSFIDGDTGIDDPADDKWCPLIDGFHYCRFEQQCSTPARLRGISDVSKLAVGQDYACALTRYGQIYCWGMNNTYQGPGEGRCQIPKGTEGSLASAVCYRPTQVLNIPRMRDIALSMSRTCAVSVSRGLYCWGSLPDNMRSQVVQGFSGRGSLPTQQTAWPALSQIAAGVRHLCGLTTSGKAVCLPDDERAPREIEGTGKLVELVSSHGMTCGRNEAGEVWCWMPDPNRPVAAKMVPYRVPGITGSKALSAAESFVCSLQTDASVYCWGWWERGGSYVANPPIEPWDAN